MMKRATCITGLKMLLVPAILVFLLPCQVKSQERISLADAIRIGLENNFQIRIIENTVEIARNNNRWGTAGLFPTISLGVNQTNRYDNLPGQMDPDDRSRTITSRVAPYVNLQWILFSGFNVHMTKDKLAALEAFSEGNAVIVVENTIQGIILAYYNALLQLETLKTLDELKQLSRDRYDYVTYRKDLGAAVTYDVLQAKNAYLDDSTNYLLQQLNVENAFLYLRLLLGEESDMKYELTDEFAVVEQEFIYDSLFARMRDNNANLRNQYINQEILKKDVSIARSAAYPYLSLNAGFDHFNNRIEVIDDATSFTNNLDFYVNFTLGFNLSNGGIVRRAIQNARIGEEIGFLEMAELEVSLSNQLKNAFDLYNIRKQLYEVSLVNVESATLNLEISTDKFRSGAINSFNFRDVQIIYLRASVARLQAIFNLIDTHSELLRLSGGIIREY
jgi:outer membrane protein TolC